jgi:aspartyl-tRNA synthetase
VENCGFGVFANTVKAGGSVRGITAKNAVSTLTRKEIDKLTEMVKGIGGKGLAWVRMTDTGIASSFAKFLSEAENNAIMARMGLEDGDLILVVADKNKVVFDTLGALRCECAKRLGLLDPFDFKFLWVTEFPLFEYSEEDGRFYAMHHPFTAPMAEDYEFIDSDPGRVRARAYDIVLNGTELGGGSIRINTTEMQEHMFSILGIGKEEAQEKFGFLLDAFKYGVPPHGGLAFGLDRLVTLLLGLEDIREVIAFPKMQNASELMSKCPSFANPDDLKELGIAVIATEDEN